MQDFNKQMSNNDIIVFFEVNCAFKLAKHSFLWLFFPLSV